MKANGQERFHSRLMVQCLLCRHVDACNNDVSKLSLCKNSEFPNVTLKMNVKVIDDLAQIRRQSNSRRLAIARQYWFTEYTYVSDFNRLSHTPCIVDYRLEMCRSDRCSTGIYK